MRANSFFLFTLITLAIGVTASRAQTTLNTVPEGAVTFTFPATGSGQTVVNYYSAPLSSDPVYTGAVATVTATTITIPDSPAPWTANQFAAVAAPYFVKFLNGSQAGRAIRVVSNTTNSLTLDTTDNSSQTVSLLTSSFSVAGGDSFEVFPGDTIASLFGSQVGSLILVGGTSALNADSLSIYNPALSRFQSYYFDNNSGFWRQSGSTANFNNTVVYPYSTFAATRRPGEAASNLVLMGRVPEVSRLIKTPGSSTVVYDSTGYPVDMKLSSLFPTTSSNWTEGASAITADLLSVWNPTLSRFDTYFQFTDGTWRKSGGGSTDQSNFVIPAATTVVYTKHLSVTGGSSFIKPVIPYTF